MIFIVTGPPPAALEILPSGMTGKKPNFIWREVSSASWYYLWVNDPSGTPVIQQWYTAAQVGCPAGTGNCTVSPSVALPNGTYTWWILAWNENGYGPWSSSLKFVLAAASSYVRF